MPDRLWNIEWPNVNTQRKYPLMEGQSARDGDFVLPDDLIVDLSLAVNIGLSPTLDPTLFHVSQVGVFSSGITISLAYNGVVFSTVSVPLAGFTEYSSYPVVGVVPFFDSRGWITIGKLSSVLKFPGAWNFTIDTARFVPSCIRPNLRSLTSVRVVNGTDYSEAMSGDITLVAGQNFRFRVDLDNNKIIFDCLDGAGMTAECDCNNLDEQAPCIRTINGVGPNANGDLTLRGTTCVQLTGGTNAITIEDTCSQPCCDCRELQVVTTQLEAMLNEITSLEIVASKLDAVIQNIQGNILASKTTGIPR
jgi:hypothetical protein